jgi:hypothetical protein
LAVGFGLKITGGVPKFEAALHYYVAQKLDDEAEIRKLGSEPVPAERHGYTTDVIELPVATAVTNDRGQATGSRGTRIENPLVGGTSTEVLSNLHSFPEGYGTLGGICFDSTNNAAMVLSNAHVWGSSTGRDVIQPWLPVDEYLTAAAKLLLCGPEAFIFDTTVPSALTAGLTAAAAGVWIAAVASDAEDPNRWGQRVDGPPAANAATTSEVIHLEADVPEEPFAGRAYRATTRWRYERQTNVGSSQQALDETRANEHVLLGKRVWTARDRYHAGDRVLICAEVTTAVAHRAEDYFVVAVCHPQSAPETLMRRVLVPGVCRNRQKRTKDVCFRGFAPPAKPGEMAWLPVREGVFSIDSHQPGRYVGPWPGAGGLTILQLPREEPLRVIFPPSTRARVEVLQQGSGKVIAEARNSAGLVVSKASTSGPNPNGERLKLEADELVEVDLRGGGGRGHLVGACASSGPPPKTHPPGVKDVHRFTYTGEIDLGLSAARDRWGVSLYVQTVDNTPVDGDPITAARKLGGITASANMLNAGGCVLVELLDHVFDVI